MSREDDEFLQRLLAAFQVEAAEHLQVISSGLIELEAAPEMERRRQLVENIFREAHSLKGAARAVDLRQIETLCQALESVFAIWKKEDGTPRPEHFDVLHRSVDLATALLQPQSSPRAAAVAETVQQIDRLRESPNGGLEPAISESAAAASEFSSLAPAAVFSDPGAADSTVAHPLVPVPENRAATETVRISTAKLDSVLLQAEEMLTAKLIAAQHTLELREISAEIGRLRGAWSKVEAELLAWRNQLADSARKSAGDSRAEANAARLKALEARLHALLRSTEREQRSLGSRVDNLLEDAKRLVMLPFGSLLEGLPRLVRELARDQGKEIQLLLHGHEVEMDKRMIEELKDPLMHLLRNCVDHGIEPPSARLDKPPRGIVEVAVSQSGGREVKIRVSDDGRGIDVAKVKSAAVKKEKITAEQARRLTDEEACELVFRSEITTSKLITDLSGRGLGLAIVREKIAKLGGRISVQSEVGRGAVFHMTLPVTLATLRAVFVYAGGQTFALPITDVDRVVAVGSHEIRPVEGRETISLDQQVVPLVRLDETLNLPARATHPPVSESGRISTRIAAIVLGSAEQRIAFRVDEIGAEREVLVKPLGRPLLRVRNVAGATILADGRPVPLLHVPDLLKSAAAISYATRASALADGSAARVAHAHILVAEDSITSRMLLKNILESAGYPVTTAVDGADALATLRTGDFGLVVSDVDMPRMTGFELTAAIRQDQRLANLPVVLITARETREDRERGIDVGANAYIIKSSFDQSDLLDVVRRLV